jgi:hypothetical protein
MRFGWHLADCCRDRNRAVDLGFIDLEQKTLQPLDNPFGTGLSPMS